MVSHKDKRVCHSIGRGNQEIIYILMKVAHNSLLYHEQIDRRGGGGLEEDDQLFHF